MSKAKSPTCAGGDDYQAEDDARHLMRAHEIASDPKRHAKAGKALDKLHADKQKEAIHAKAAKGLKKAFGGG